MQARAAGQWQDFTYRDFVDVGPDYRSRPYTRIGPNLNISNHVSCFAHESGWVDLWRLSIETSNHGSLLLGKEVNYLLLCLTAQGVGHGCGRAPLPEAGSIAP